MAISVTSPITGSAQTGFTSPSAVVTVDTPPPGSYAKQWVVTSMTGASGINAGSVSCPFTITFTRPTTLRTLAPVNPLTGILREVPKNVYKVHTIKGVLPLAGQAYESEVISTEVRVPAGADLADPVNVRAGVSVHVGVLNQQSANIGDTVTTGIL